jgi:hypothetical protein
VRRELRLTTWFDEKELAEIRAAAEAAGMAPAAYVAQAGTDAARAAAAGRPPAGQVADVVAAMDAATAQAKKAGNLFNQEVRALHITGQRSAELDRHAAATARAVRRMEAATLRAARELLR